MRRKPALSGIKSVFSRAARKVKAFFGWNEAEDEVADEAALNAVLRQDDAGEEKPEKKGDGNDDDGGDEAMPSRKGHRQPDEPPNRGSQAVMEPERRKKVTNYAIPIGMDEDEYYERIRREEEARRIREAERRKREKELARINEAERQKQLARHRQRTRLAQNAREAEAPDKDELLKRTLRKLVCEVPPEKPEREADCGMSL